MTSSIYTLNNGAKGVEEDRLEFQHRVVFTPCTGGLLPANIRSHLEAQGPSAAVADVGTGIGIWLKDLAQELHPSAQLDGFDFDTTKFPDEAQLPANVKLHFQNVLEPVPNAYRGRYDVVHVRLLMFALKREQWVEAARNLLEMLKPGGWLLWDELSFTSWVALPMTKRFGDWMSLETRFGESVGRDSNVGINLIRYVKSAGFENCSQHCFSTFALEDPQDRRIAGLALISAGSQSMHGIVERGGFDWIRTHEDATRTADGLRADVENGLCEIGFEIYWVTAQRPM